MNDCLLKSVNLTVVNKIELTSIKTSLTIRKEITWTKNN